MSWPLTNDDSFEIKKSITFDTSFGVPSLPVGVLVEIEMISFFDKFFLVILVFINPGVIELTLISCPDRSIHKFLTNPFKRCFEDVYRLLPCLPNLPYNDDIIIIDCPPSLGLLTINALTASNAIVIPIQCEYYALEGLGQLLNTVRLVQRHLNKKLEITGILMTMYDGRLNLSKQVVDEVNSFFKEKLFKTFIHRNVRLSEAPSFGKPALLYDANSTGAQNYMNLTEEILQRVS